MVKDELPKAHLRELRTDSVACSMIRGATAQLEDAFADRYRGPAVVARLGPSFDEWIERYYQDILHRARIPIPASACERLQRLLRPKGCVKGEPAGTDGSTKALGPAPLQAPPPAQPAHQLLGLPALRREQSVTYFPHRFSLLAATTRRSRGISYTSRAYRRRRPSAAAAASPGTPGVPARRKAFALGSPHRGGTAPSPVWTPCLQRSPRRDSPPLGCSPPRPRSPPSDGAIAATRPPAGKCTAAALRLRW